LGDVVVFHRLAGVLPFWATVWGWFMVRASGSGVSMVWRRSANSVPNLFYQAVWLLEGLVVFGGGVSWECVCRGRRRVVWQTVGRLFSQDRGYRMVNTSSPVIPEVALHSSKRNIDGTVSPRLPMSSRPQQRLD